MGVALVTVSRNYRIPLEFQLASSGPSLTGLVTGLTNDQNQIPECIIVALVLITCKVNSPRHDQVMKLNVRIQPPHT